jgi:hypothetical protein
VRVLNYLVEIFIAGFGITRPTEAKRRQVAIVLGGFLLATLILALALGAFLAYSIHSGR